MSSCPASITRGSSTLRWTADQPLELSEESADSLFHAQRCTTDRKIASSNNTLDKIWRASNASYLSNLFGYPTDCPHREKNGWTGDAHNASEMGLYNFDGITVYEKWLADHRDEQQSNGVLPAIIPTSGWGLPLGQRAGLDQHYRHHPLERLPFLRRYAVVGVVL